MTDLHWTFLVLGLIAIAAQRSMRGAWAILVLAAAGLVALVLDATGWVPNYVWIAAEPIALAGLADLGNAHGKYAPREPSDPS